ncbi:UNVERIFIED_CONTAM: hypothetical protein FKN15_041046 [Acipenser sinensis]
MKEQGHATAGGEEVGGDRGTREEEPASRAPPPGPDLQDHSDPPQPNPQPERDAQRQEKREHSAGEGRIPESEGEGVSIMNASSIHTYQSYQSGQGISDVYFYAAWTSCGLSFINSVLYLLEWKNAG